MEWFWVDGPGWGFLDRIKSSRMMSDFFMSKSRLKIKYPLQKSEIIKESVSI